MRFILQLCTLTALCLVLASIAATDDGTAAQAHPYHFVVQAPDTSTLYIGYAEGGPPVRVADYEHLLGVAWAPDTLTAAVAALHEQELMIHRLNLLNGERSTVSAGRVAASLRDLDSLLAWSADGSYSVLRLDMAIGSGEEVTHTTRLAAMDAAGLAWSVQRAAHEPETVIQWVGNSNQLYDVTYTSPTAGVESQVLLERGIMVTLGPCRAECGLRAWSADGDVAYHYDTPTKTIIRRDTRTDTAQALPLDIIFDTPDTLNPPQIHALHTHHAPPYTYLEVEARGRFFTSEYGPRAPLVQFDALFRIDERDGVATTFAAPFTRNQIVQVDAEHGVVLVRDGEEQTDVRLTDFERRWMQHLPWDAAGFWVTEDKRNGQPITVIRGATDAYRVPLGHTSTDPNMVERLELPRGSVVSNDGRWYIQDRRGTSAAVTGAFVVGEVEGDIHHRLNLAGMQPPRWHDTIPFPPRPDWPRTLAAVLVGVLGVLAYQRDLRMSPPR
jgi:hypothetical protein